MSDPAECVFEGTAAAFRVVGEGRAVLVEPGPFKDGHAAFVFLRGATLEGGATNPRIERPAPMSPVGMNPKGRAFDVTYTAGNPVSIDIAAGGENGGYQGPLPDNTPCPPEWCRIAWHGEAKHVALGRNTELPFEVAGWFPFVSAGSDEPGKPTSKLTRVELRGVSGELRCGDQASHVEGDWTWSVGPTASLVLRGPDTQGATRRVLHDRGVFRIAVENETPPVHVGFSVSVGLVAAIATGTLLLLVAALAARRLLRNKPVPAPTARATGDVGVPETLAPTAAKSAPLQVFVSSCPEDTKYLDRLETGLKPRVREERICLFSARDVPEGAEPAALISAKLRAADLVLLLVSSDYLASDACQDQELAHAIERHDRGEAIVIPIFVRDCVVTGQPFARIQGLPPHVAGREKPRPIAAWKGKDEQDEVWATVTARLFAAIDRLEASKGKTGSAKPNP